MKKGINPDRIFIFIQSVCLCYFYIIFDKFSLTLGEVFLKAYTGCSQGKQVYSIPDLMVGLGSWIILQEYALNSRLRNMSEKYVINESVG